MSDEILTGTTTADNSVAGNGSGEALTEARLNEILEARGYVNRDYVDKSYNGAISSAVKQATAKAQPKAQPKPQAPAQTNPAIEQDFQKFCYYFGVKNTDNRVWRQMYDMTRAFGVALYQDDAEYKALSRMRPRNSREALNAWRGALYSKAQRTGKVPSSNAGTTSVPPSSAFRGRHAKPTYEGWSGSDYLREALKDGIKKKK